MDFIQGEEILKASIDHEIYEFKTFTRSTTSNVCEEHSEFFEVIFFSLLKSFD
jgi:hypothetical protein